tara:strand:- start:383 stop:739 length:357 start_codon:yes stop_codon:yes gene_type:complete
VDPTTTHEIFLNLATNSPFLAFVMYNWYSMSRQNEEYRKEMKADRDAYEVKREKAIEEIRGRYVAVIEDLKEEKKGGIEDRLTSMEKAIKKLFVMMDKLKEEINELKIKDKVRDERNR